MTLSGWYTRGLRRLDLSCNLLSTVPLSISRLSSLTILNLSKNVIIALPETISSLVSLKTIDLSENHLTVLPCGLGMASELEQIIVRQNPLLAPPIELLRKDAATVVKYLRGVHLARKTGRLDWNALGLNSLDSLVVCRSKFCTAQYIPFIPCETLNYNEANPHIHKPSFLDVNTLSLRLVLQVMLPDGDTALVEELYVDDNLLVCIHPSVLYELQNLQVLRCCRNYLTSIHPNLGIFCKDLEQLTLDGNYFSTVPHELGTLTKLISVSFDNNPHLISPPPEINELPSQVCTDPITLISRTVYLRNNYQSREYKATDSEQPEIHSNTQSCPPRSRLPICDSCTRHMPTAPVTSPSKSSLLSQPSFSKPGR